MSVTDNTASKWNGLRVPGVIFAGVLLVILGMILSKVLFDPAVLQVEIKDLREDHNDLTKVTREGMKTLSEDHEEFRDKFGERLIYLEGRVDAIDRIDNLFNIEHVRQHQSWREELQDVHRLIDSLKTP